MRLFSTLNEAEGNYEMPTMEEIQSGQNMPTLYRVAFSDQLESLFKYGYNRAFTGTKGGNMYGPGVYCTFNLKDSIYNVKTKPEYGNCIVQMRLIGGYYGFIIFDETLAKQTYGVNWKIKDQLINAANFNPYIAQEIENACSKVSSLYHGRTAPAAYYLWSRFEQNLFKKHGVKGLIYKGNRDGHCALPYNFSSVIPYAVSFDQGKTFKIHFNKQLYDFLNNHTDVEFRFGGRFKKVSQSINGFTMVEDNRGKYNIIQNSTNKVISDSWFDSVDGQIHPETGIFGFMCDGIHFDGCIYSPDNTSVGCILDPFDKDPYCPLSDLKELIKDIKSKGYSDFEEYVMNDPDEQNTNESKIVIKQLVESIVSDYLNEEHLKVVDNINEITKFIGENWKSPDDMWWIMIESRLKDFKNFNTRNNSKHFKHWSRVNGPDGAYNSNHVGYVIVRGATKKDCQNSLLNAVVHLNPWAAKILGVKSIYSNGNAEAIKLVCTRFFARAYVTINKRSIKKVVNISRLDKTRGLFKGREFHHRAGQPRIGIDKSGVNWTKERPLGLIDCDVDDATAQKILEEYLAKNQVQILMKRPSHDGMHYIVYIDEVQGLDFSFMDKFSSNNVAGDPNVLFKPDSNITVYSAIG